MHRSLLVSVAMLGSAYVTCAQTTPSGRFYPTYDSIYSGIDSYFRFTFSDLPTGYSIQNGSYRSWCAEQGVFIQPSHWVELLKIADSQVNTLFPSSGWAKLNYLLNHKRGGPWDVQSAVWLLLEGRTKIQPVSADTKAMIDEADRYGAGFVPGKEHARAVVMYYDGYTRGSFTSQMQDAVLEFHCPLTQGYWQRYLEGSAGGKKPKDGNWGISGFAIAGRMYSLAELLAILKTPVKGDAAMILLHQYIAAMLNGQKGANTWPVADALQQAEQYLGAYLSAPPPNHSKIEPSSPAGQLMTAVAARLDEFNNGRNTPGCAE